MTTMKETPENASQSRLCIDDVPLAYSDRLEARDPLDIVRAVVHCTELPELADARRYAERIHYRESGTGNSGHYYIDRDGSIYRYVAEDRIAHHVRGHNRATIGVELVNRGRYPDWFHSNAQRADEPYPDAQIDALVRLLNDCAARLDNLRYVCGHDALDTELVPAEDDPSLRVPRKMDPGPLFPWQRLVDRVALEHSPR